MAIEVNSTTGKWVTKEPPERGAASLGFFFLCLSGDARHEIPPPPLLVCVGMGERRKNKTNSSQVVGKNTYDHRWGKRNRYIISTCPFIYFSSFHSKKKIRIFLFF